MKSEYLILSGSHYDINHQIGEMFKRDIQKYAKSIDVAGNLDLLNNSLNFFKTNYPTIYDEFLGRANGAGVSPQEYMAICTYELWFKKLQSAPTFIFARKTNKFCTTKMATHLQSFIEFFAVIQTNVCLIYAGRTPCTAQRLVQINICPFL